MKSPILPGAAPIHWGFTSDRFENDSYLWHEKGRIMISFIVSVEKGKGYFSQLVKAIEADGFKVAVPTPSGRMQDILSRWGFHKTLEDAGEMGTCEVWVR